jgi:hypothetical protein
VDGANLYAAYFIPSTTDPLGLACTPKGKECPCGKEPVQSSAPNEPNGCGPEGWFDPIPDVPLGLIDFTEACNGHDTCYGECGGKDKNHKNQCDEGFKNSMILACNWTYENCLSVNPEIFEDEECQYNLTQEDIMIEQSRQTCLRLAHTYYEAVSNRGCGFYKSAQEEACTCPGN